MIYVIHADGYCKIGFTANSPYDRIKNLQIGCPHDMTLMMLTPGHQADEKELHSHFHDKWVRGEWFKLSMGDIRYIRERWFPDALPELTRPEVIGGEVVIQPDDDVWIDDDEPIDLGDDFKIDLG